MLMYICRGFDDATKGFIESSVIYQPQLIHQHSRFLERPYEDDMVRNIPKMKSVEFGIVKPSTRAAKIHRTRFTSCYVDSSTTPRDNSHKLWDEIIPQRHLLHRGPMVSYDIDTIALLLNEPTAHDKCIHAVTWILSKSPPETTYHKIDRVLEEQANSARNSILIIVLAAEARLDIDEENPESLQVVAQPFQKFIKFYESTMTRLVANSGYASQGQRTGVSFLDIRSSAKESMSHPKIKLFHLYTFSEVVARSYVLFDEHMIGKTNAMQALTSPTFRIRIANGFFENPDQIASQGMKDNFTLPSVAYIGEILREHFPTNTVERIIGRPFVFAKKKKRASSRDKSNESKGFFGMFSSKKKAVEESVEDEFEQLLDNEGKDRIKNFAEYSEIKKRFDEEYQLLLLREIREYFSLFLDDAKKTRENILEKNWKIVNSLFCGIGPSAGEPMKRIGQMEEEEKEEGENNCIVS
jgi:hypothetical protein